MRYHKLREAVRAAISRKQPHTKGLPYLMPPQYRLSLKAAITRCMNVARKADFLVTKRDAVREARLCNHSLVRLQYFEHTGRLGRW